tara:strand:+ start:13646 stop:14401 length:756 start_codon:yes stop_codon:yes gene_type:complete
VSKLEIRLNKKVKILLTRPEKDSKNFSEYLDKNFFEYYLAPLIKIIKCKYEFDKNVDYDFLLFTSKNGLRNFQKIEHKKKIFVIGDGTFNLAKKIGYANVVNIKGDSNDLKIKMKPFLKQSDKILHPTSTLRNIDLENFFGSEGCYYKQLRCYKSVMINQKSEVFEKFFKSCKDGLITLFSRRTAISFKKEISKLGLMQNHRGKKILTLSDSIAKEIKELNFKKVYVCSQPNERAMLKLIREVCQKEMLID